MAEEIKRTRLYDWHVRNKARTAAFGGYDMPLWYTSAKSEHLAVLTHAGLFDTSHMAAVVVAGADARDLLQWCFSNDLERAIGKSKAPLREGRCIYGAFLNPAGEVIDDAIVYQFDAACYMVVVNAAMGGPVADHLREQAGERQVTVTDLTDRLGKLDVQGPAAGRILSRILADPEAAFDGLFYFSFKGGWESDRSVSAPIRLKNGTPVLLSRTGYTGEFGFELFTAADDLVPVWEAIFAAGQDQGLIPCGLAARDSLRAGAVLPLSHQDIGHWPFMNHPWPFALPMDDAGSGFTKDFLGAGALGSIENPQYTYPFAGQDLRKVTLPAIVADEQDNVIGTVLTCATDVAIGRVEGRIFSVASPDKPADFKARGLSCGFVKVSQALPSGTRITLKDQRRSLPVTIVEDIRPHRTARAPIRSMLG